MRQRICAVSFFPLPETVNNVIISQTRGGSPMTNITAKMAHSKESVELMCITQYNTFEFGKKIALLVISAALIVFGVVARVSTSISLVCIMIGCFMLTGRNAVAKSRADAVIKQLGGQLPVFNYSFGPTKFSFNPDTEPVSYTSFSRLAEDSNYLYMFLQNRAAFMVQKNTVSGGSVNDLKELIARKSNLTWKQPVTLLNFSLKSLSNRDDRFQGPRL